MIEIVRFISIRCLDWIKWYKWWSVLRLHREIPRPFHFAIDNSSARHPMCVRVHYLFRKPSKSLSHSHSIPSTHTLTHYQIRLKHFFPIHITWRSGAVFGCATSQADSHGFSWAKNPVCDPPSPLSFFVTEFEFPIVVGLLCWLVLRRAPEINTSAITTSPGPGRILTSGSAVLAWCKHDWDALATPNDIVA